MEGIKMRVFLSHPYASNPKLNKEKVEKIAKYMVRKGITPLSPLHLFSFYEGDSNREEIMKICKYLIDIADEVWIYGDSKGCLEELKYAKKKGKPIRLMFSPIDYKELMEK